MEVLNRIDVLNDAIQYYWGKPERRCVSINGGCQYKPSETSEGCAVGRLLPLDVAESLQQDGEVSDNRVFSLLPSNVQDLGQDFLQGLQVLHDSEYFTKCNRDCICTVMSQFVDENQIIFPN